MATAKKPLSGVPGVPAVVDATAVVEQDDQPTMTLYLANTRRALDIGGESARYPGNFQRIVYTSHLEGVPFVFAGEPTFANEDTQYGPRAYCEVGVYLFDEATGHRMQPTATAHLTGGYVLASLRNLASKWDVVLGSHLLYTMARYEYAKQYRHPSTGEMLYPLTLAVYDPSQDSMPPSPASVFDEDGPAPANTVTSNSTSTSTATSTATAVPDDGIIDRAAFLRACAGLSVRYHNTANIVADLGVRSLVGLNLTIAYNTLARLQGANKARGR